MHYRSVLNNIHEDSYKNYNPIMQISEAQVNAGTRIRTHDLSKQLLFPDHFDSARNVAAQRPVFQDPGSNFVEVEIGQTAVLPCFAIGSPPPMTR